MRYFIRQADIFKPLINFLFGFISVGLNMQVCLIKYVIKIKQILFFYSNCRQIKSTIIVNNGAYLLTKILQSINKNNFVKEKN